DLDEDGDLDAYVANNAQPNSVWLNDGHGIFADGGQALGSGASAAVAMGDIDGDGDLDAVVGNLGAPNTTWLNDGTGNFTAQPEPIGSDDSRGVSLGDLDGDGDLDSFIANVGRSSKIGLNICPGLIGDFVWDDLNGNGLQDVGEPGISNTTVEAWWNSTLLDTAVTGPAGTWQLSIPAYDTNMSLELRFFPPAGFLPTRIDQGDDGLDSDVDENNTITIDLIPPTTNLTFDAGYTGPFSVQNHIPNTNQTDASAGGSIQIIFDQPLDTSSVSAASFIVRSEETGVYPTGSISTVGNTLTFSPAGGFRFGDRVTVELSQDIISVNYNQLIPYRFDFTVEALGCANLTFIENGQGLDDGPAFGCALGDLDGDGDLD
ncbi:MAG: FG-GAP-like repeat-containing protein, partial [Verrucomicrobiota bacterium]